MNEAETTSQALVAQQEHQLALLERAKAALAEAKSIEDVLEVRDQASALKAYAEKKKLGEAAVRIAKELLLRAHRRLGEFTREMGKAQGKRTDRTSHSANAKCEATKEQALEAVGINRDTASKFERIAAIPAERFEEEVRKPEATTRSLASIGGERRASGRVPPRRPPAPSARPSVSDRIRVQRALMFRVAVEKVARKYLGKWPDDFSALGQVLIEVGSQVREGGSA